MHSLTVEQLTQLRYDGLQLSTLRALGEYRGKQKLFVAQSAEALADLKQQAVIESAESSSRLEGVIVSPSRLKSLMIKNAQPKSRSEQEVAGYRDALSLIHEACDAMPFSEGTVRLVLRALKSEGLIESTGKGRSAKWRNRPVP